MSELKEVINQISSLKSSEKLEEYLFTISYIVELMRQVEEGRFKGANLLKIFKHKMLTIRVEYGQEQPKTKNLFGKYYD